VFDMPDVRISPYSGRWSGPTSVMARRPRPDMPGTMEDELYPVVRLLERIALTAGWHQVLRLLRRSRMGPREDQYV